jgi:hypothetical protein
MAARACSTWHQGRSQPLLPARDVRPDVPRTVHRAALPARMCARATNASSSIDGEAVGAINRVPAEHDARSNMHAGGRAEPTELTKREKRDLRAHWPVAERTRLHPRRHRRDRRLHDRDQRDVAHRRARGQALRRRRHCSRSSGMRWRRSAKAFFQAIVGRRIRGLFPAEPPFRDVPFANVRLRSAKATVPQSARGKSSRISSIIVLVSFRISCQISSCNPGAVARSRFRQKRVAVLCASCATRGAVARAGAVMVARVSTIAFQGIEGVPVDVQVMVAPGKVGMQIVGLADKAVAESRERVQAALARLWSLAAAEARHRQSCARRSSRRKAAITISPLRSA